MNDLREILKFYGEMGAEFLHLPGSDPRADLAELNREILQCRRCRLHESKTHYVPGEGSNRPGILFVGEGPGETEDQFGRPFIGKAGQLLDKIIQKMGMQRGDVFIANVVKCRPPGNRLPEPEEIATCSPFLRRQINAIRPLFICTLGSCAVQTLLSTSEPVSRLRGRFLDYQGIRVLPTFHPAYLLRNPEKKREVWEDMKLLMKEFPYED